MWKGKTKPIDHTKLLIATRVMDAEINQQVKKTQQELDAADRQLGPLITAKNPDEIRKTGRKAVECERKIAAFQQIKAAIKVIKEKSQVIAKNPIDPSFEPIFRTLLSPVEALGLGSFSTFRDGVIKEMFSMEQIHEFADTQKSGDILRKAFFIPEIIDVEINEALEHICKRRRLNFNDVTALIETCKKPVQQPKPLITPANVHPFEKQQWQDLLAIIQQI